MSKAIRVACSFYIDETQQLALQVHLKKAMWRTTAQAFRELLEQAGNEIIKEAFLKLYPEEEFKELQSIDHRYTKKDFQEDLEELVADNPPTNKEVVERKIELQKPSDKKGKAA